ncbi:uncharacterized protein LOC121388624 [Gigantopelta aegis]|uniref:uncharacterized protein LOC121388624 n=1 Tax=Gigantopelta aegis TaxID=1735272 RepID=UPI001B88A6F8|nr:uncharacterized protein LOC121388624 [Gigantopelta aegis]XP_041375978.1 uncharacterized protein LOC121388624 [Gigantopelta aegis]
MLLPVSGTVPRPMQIIEELFIFVTLLIIGHCVPGSMEERDQAKNLYRKARDNDCLGPPEQADIRRTVVKLLQKSQNRQNYKTRFRYQEFASIIDKTANCGKFVAVKTSAAFILLEKYLLLLFTFPWKKEFHKLKTYCGFFQCRIKSHLEEAENIFKLIGFRESDNSTLVLTGGNVNQELVFDVAFECVVASVECEMIGEYHRCISEKGGSIQDAVAFRLAGLIPDLSRKKPSEHVDSVACYKRQIIYPDASRELQQRGFSSGNTVPNIPKGLPFIDEDLSDSVAEVAPKFQMGTIDEHMMASLQKVKTLPERGLMSAASNSEDWSYVRLGLENRYGKSYYDGVRGDVINPSNRHAVSGRVPEERDDISDEGIDVCEGPPPVRIDPPRPVGIDSLARRDPRSHPQMGDAMSIDMPGKSFQTSGYRTGVYLPATATYPPSNSVVCDEAPLSPGVSPSSATFPYSTRSPTPRAAQTAPRSSQLTTGAVRGVPMYNHRQYNTNNLSNIARKARGGESSGAFRVDKVSNRGYNTPDMELKLTNERWKCETCTMDNHSGSKVCDVCGKSRIPSLQMDGPQVGESVRICSQCTLENKPGSSVCGACQTELVPNNINTYV